MNGHGTGDTSAPGYGWIIDIDHVNDRHTPTPTSGPRNIPVEIYKRLRAGEGEKFRMLDDDRNLYYEGRIIHEEGFESCWGAEGFEPLEDFGMPNAGCTTIQYQSTVTKVWEDL